MIISYQVLKCVGALSLPFVAGYCNVNLVSIGVEKLFKKSTQENKENITRAVALCTATGSLCATIYITHWVFSRTLQTCLEDSELVRQRIVLGSMLSSCLLFWFGADRA